MVRFQDAELDLVFGALSHSARRATLKALVDGASNVIDLAAPHGMSLVEFMKHVTVLEEASLIACEKEGQVHCRAGARTHSRGSHLAGPLRTILGCAARRIGPPSVPPEGSRFRAKADQVGKPPAVRPDRHYDAAPEKVWRAWTEPEEMKRWWGPGQNDVVRLAGSDVRVGGRFRVAFTSDSDEMLEVRGVDSEIVPNRKLVFTWAWKSAPEQESRVTVTFRLLGGGTDLTLLHEQFFDAGARDAREEGWSSALAKIDAVIARH